jgi:hypothetical protein
VEDTAVRGKHACLQQFLIEEEQQGRPVIAMAITETHLKGHAEIMPVDGYTPFYRHRKEAGHTEGCYGW